MKILLMLFLSFVFSSSVFASLKGRLLVSNSLKSEAGQMVVWIAGLKSGAQKNKDKSYSMDQKDKEFKPGILAIRKGDVVLFENQDNIYHNVFSLHKGNRFDLGVYKGKTKWSDDLTKKIKSSTIPRAQFNDPGKVEIYCNIHQNMKGAIYVFDHPYYALVDGSGKFEMQAVPDGDYNFFVDGEQFKKLLKVKGTVKKGQISLRVNLKNNIRKGTKGHTRKDGTKYGGDDLDEFY